MSWRQSPIGFAAALAAAKVRPERDSYCDVPARNERGRDPSQAGSLYGTGYLPDTVFGQLKLKLVQVVFR